MINKCKEGNYETLQSEIQKRMLEIKTVLKTLSIGNSDSKVIAKKLNGHERLFIYKKGDSTNKKYVKEKDMSVVSRAVNQEYTSAIINALESELSALKALSDFYSRQPIDNIYNNMSTSKQILVKPIRVPTEELLAKFKSIKQNTKEIDDNSSLTTARGEKVRSKNELIIANELYYNGIPYLYEPELKLDDGNIIHPDFVIFNLRIREIFIWEHFGMMSNPFYVERAIQKIHAYNKSGFSGHLITTFEVSGSRFIMSEIQDIIQTRLK